MLETSLQSGADLFLWIVCILVAFIAAVSFIDFKKTMGPSDPFVSHEEHGDKSYYESRKHAEDVHREFPKEKVNASKDPARPGNTSTKPGEV